MKTRLLFPLQTSALSRLNRLLLTRDFRDTRKFIIVDSNCYSCCLPHLIANVRALESSEFFEVPVGEEAKSVEIAAQLWGALLDSGADRSSVVINLGGGSVSDLGGFVAAGFKRGIRHINIPTTLIGMADASVGGKTAVNIDGSKNQVGFFHHPVAVCVDTAFLETLPDTEIASGTLEVCKTLLLSDEAALHDLYRSLPSDCDGWQRYAEQCLAFKQAVVHADPEEHSTRKILNLGHTFGHAIESYALQQGKPMPHGIAVGIGMACELYLSVRKLGLDHNILDDYMRFLSGITSLPHFSLRDTEPLLAFMRHDKKNHGDETLCVMLKAIGEPVIDVAVSDNEVRDALLSALK